MKKRIMALILTLGLIIGTVAGCGSKEKAGESTAAKDTGVMELQILGTSTGTDFTKSEVAKKLCDKYNVTFKMIDVGEAYMDTYQTMIASGETPDYFLWIPRANFDQFQQQGVFASIPDGLVNKECPELYEWYQKYISKEDPFKYTSVEGKNYGLPVLWTLGETSNVSAIREDWLNKVGITKIPETLDELHTALLAFRNEDPDGNGKQDTYGWTSMLDTTGVPTMFTPVFGAYGVYPGIFSEKDGKIVRGEVEPEAKAALETLNQWYEEGILDPEFVVDKLDTCKEKWIAEKYGYATEKWYEFIPQSAFNSGFYHDKLTEKNSNAKITITSAPKGADGQNGMVQINPMRGDMINFSAHMADKPELMAKYIQVFGDAAFNNEILKMTWKGIEGVTYKQNKDGGYEFIGEYTDLAKREEFGVGFTALGSNFPDYDLLTQFMTEPKYLEIRKTAQSKGSGKTDPLAPVLMQAWTEKGDALNQFATKSFVDFITGVRPISEFDDYVAEWYKQGGDKVLEEAQTKYDSLNK